MKKYNEEMLKAKNMRMNKKWLQLLRVKKSNSNLIEVVI